VSILFEANRTRTDRDTDGFGSGTILRDGGADMVSVHASEGAPPEAQAHTSEGILFILRAVYLEKIEPKLTSIQTVWVGTDVGAAVVGIRARPRAAKNTCIPSRELSAHRET
jgi:hypothetical protein